MENYDYKVKENIVPAVLGGFMILMVIVLFVVEMPQILSEENDQLVCFWGLVLGLFILAVLLFTEYKRRALYIIREGREYCYVPFLGKRRYFRREDICDVKIRPVKFSPQDLCLVATDHNGRKIFGVELNMVNAKRLAKELIPDFNYCP